MSDNPYEPPQHDPPDFRKLRGKRWLVTLDGHEHQIVLKHDKGGMATEVFIDDEQVYKYGGFTTILTSADIPLTFGEHQILISIRDKWIGSEYALRIDGQLIDGPDFSHRSVEDDRLRRTRVGACIGLFLAAPYLCYIGLQGWYVGPFPAQYTGIALGLLSIVSLLRGRKMVRR